MDPHRISFETCVDNRTVEEKELCGTFITHDRVVVARRGCLRLIRASISCMLGTCP